MCLHSLYKTEQVSHGLWSSAGLKMPIYGVTHFCHWLITTRKVGQTDLVWDQGSLVEVHVYASCKIISLCVVGTICATWLLSRKTHRQTAYINRSASWATSNVTGCHRGPKQKLRAGYRALSLQCSSYLCVGLLWSASSIFHRQVWNCALLLRYVCAMHVFDVWASSSAPRLPLCQISFLSHPPLLS